ncbi:MAG: hypothetical protein IIB56_03175 [Planctomycetes bacterium]|nr:hypothetical protein [Planctomycetota bacterium]
MSLEPKELLLEEWKQNVALYIDQDKRGLERIKIFLTVHAGLLIFYGILWRRGLDEWSVVAAWIIVMGAIYFTIITQLMSRRAQMFIILRRLQGMLIEKRLKKIIDKERNESGKIEANIEWFSMGNIQRYNNDVHKGTGLVQKRQSS